MNHQLRELLERMVDVHPDDLAPSLRDLRSDWLSSGCPGLRLPQPELRVAVEALREIAERSIHYTKKGSSECAAHCPNCQARTALEKIEKLKEVS